VELELALRVCTAIFLYPGLPFFSSLHLRLALNYFSKIPFNVLTTFVFIFNFALARFVMKAPQESGTPHASGIAELPVELATLHQQHQQPTAPPLHEPTAHHPSPSHNYEAHQQTTDNISSPVMSPSSPAPPYTPPFSPPTSQSYPTSTPTQYSPSQTIAGTIPQQQYAQPDMGQTPPVYQTPPPQGMPYQAPPMGAAFQTPSPTGQPGQPQVVYDANGQPMVYQQQSPVGQYPPQHPQQQQYFQQQPGFASPHGASPVPQQPVAQQPQQPQQATKTGTVYHNATPIAALGRGAAPVDCPSCRQRAMTMISYEVGNSTQ
jgi:hypothetical protein